MDMESGPAKESVALTRVRERPAATEGVTPQPPRVGIGGYKAVMAPSRKPLRAKVSFATLFRDLAHPG